LGRHHTRKEKICLNCGSAVEERYCSRCGQENLEPAESVGHLVGHFFADITHFDSKIFTTLKDLVFRPGFLTREYIAGKRVRYLNPIRMYVFISAVFFLAIFAGGGDEHAPTEESNPHSTNLYRQQLADSLRAVAKATGKPEASDSIRRAVNGEMASVLDTAAIHAGAGESFGLSFGTGGKVVLDLTEYKYHDLREYDSVQQTLPDSARGKGILNWILRNNLRLKAQYHNRNHIRLESDVGHTIPRIMFVLLPMFALFVGWFYSRKKYFYVQHAIFSIHFHCFTFLLFLLTFLAEKIVPDNSNMLPLMLLLPVISLMLVFGYLVAALKGMYGQSFWLCLGKAFAISLLYLISILVVLGLLVLFTFLRT